MEIERITIKIPSDVKKKFRLAAIKNDSTMTDIIVKMVHDYIKKDEKSESEN